jgi:hypothetical protein
MSIPAIRNILPDFLAFGLSYKFFTTSATINGRPNV